MKVNTPGSRARATHKSPRVSHRPRPSPHTPGFRNYKEQGEWLELCFMARARQMGLAVLMATLTATTSASSTMAACCPVQIKSTTFSRGATFTCKVAGPGRTGYDSVVVDFFGASETKATLLFTKQKQGHKYECYLEAWNLLRE